MKSLTAPLLVAFGAIFCCALPTAVVAETAVLWDAISDSIAVQTDPSAPEELCLSGKAYVAADEGEGEYLKILPNKWHSGLILFGKKKTGYNCKMGDGKRPNFGTYAALSFRAKAYNFDASVGCEPRLDFYGGSWPRKSSNQIVLKDSYVDHGELVDYEYRNVAIPVADLVTADFPLDQIQKLTFRNCGGLSGQRYDLQGIVMTDDPPTVAGGGGGGGGGTTTEAPSASSTPEPTAPVPTEVPTPAPTAFPTEEPTPSPTATPTPAPSVGPLLDMVVYESVADGVSAESTEQSCLYFEDKGITTQVSEPEGDYMIVQPDAWRAGGLSFGCLGKTDGVCTHTCFQEGVRPDFSVHTALTFTAKLDNGDALAEGCEPRLKLYGGGSPAKESNAIVLDGHYVDVGFLVADEWRQVVIPTVDLKNAWDLNGVTTLRFLSCGTEVPAQPRFKVKDVRLTDTPPMLLSMSPTGSPTVRVTQEPSLATHFYYLNGYYPLTDKSTGTWLTAENNAWPVVPDGAAGGEYSIVVPAGSHVVYSDTMTTARLGTVVVEDQGTLEIVDNGPTSLTLSTLRVDEGGTLTIRSTGGSSISLDFEGSIDRSADPTELLNGLVSFGGTVLIEGNAVATKMAEIAQASAGSSTVTLASQVNWSPGDEVVLPDTQVGLAIEYDFIPNGYDTSSDSQLEKAIILDVDSSGKVLTLDRQLSFDHLSGAHVAMVTRSITLRTLPGSVDRAHILHTGYGAFDVKNARVEDMGRAGVHPFNSTTLTVDTTVELESGLAKMFVTKWGDNQMARYALHAHHSLVPMQFSGNAIMGGLRFGIVAHNSRVSITDNVVVEVDGTGILLEDGTETGDVKDNYIIGHGAGSGESDSMRFTPSQGKEFGHGGFAIWSRTCYSAIESNIAEGVFGESPYAFFLHINFMEDRRVPNVTGTPQDLIGKTRGEVRYDVNDGLLSLNTYGSFKGNTAFGSYKRAFGANYFLLAPPFPEGHLLEDFTSVSLGSGGAGFSFGHSNRFTVTGSLTAVAPDNTVVGVKVANGNLTFHDCQFNYTGVEVLRGGCMECFTGQENCNVFD